MIKNNKGQALLLVIAAMTVALALGINVSMRTLQSVSRTSRSDTSERVLAAAEGGLERALKLTPAVLKDGIDSTECTSKLGGTAKAGNICVISFQSGTDPIIAQAEVFSSDFTYNAAENTYTFKVEQDSVTEVNIDIAGMPSTPSIKICWTPLPKSDIYYIIYGASSVYTKTGLSSGTLGGSYTSHNFTNASPDGTGKYCGIAFTPTAGSTGLRIKSIGGDSTVEVKAVSGNLPVQGSKIVSTGTLASDATTKKVITVYKSLPYLPSMFDFGIMSVEGALLN